MEKKGSKHFFSQLKFIFNRIFSPCISNMPIFTYFCSFYSRAYHYNCLTWVEVFFSSPCQQTFIFIVLFCICVFIKKQKTMPWRCSKKKLEKKRMWMNRLNTAQFFIQMKAQIKQNIIWIRYRNYRITLVFGLPST